MKWTPKQRKIAEVVLKHRKDDGYDFKACHDELNDASKGLISRVVQQLKKTNWELPPKGDAASAVIETETPRALSGLKPKNPPVVFQVRGEDVFLSPEDLYEGYFIYLDLKTRVKIDNTYSDALKAGMETLWALSISPIVEEGGTVKIG